MNEIKPCLVCNSKNTLCEQYTENNLTLHRIRCYDCGTAFSNWDYEDSKKQAVEWFDGLTRED